MHWREIIPSASLLIIAICSVITLFLYTQSNQLLSQRAANSEYHFKLVMLNSELIASLKAVDPETARFILRRYSNEDQR